MAIMKMKKLSLTVIAAQKEELLKKLIKFGCVEFTEQELSPAEAEESGLNKVDSSILALRSRYTELANALALIEKYSPEKTKLLSAMPEVDGDILLDETGIEAAQQRAKDIISADDTLKKIGVEENRLHSQIKSLEPWTALDWRLEKEGTERTLVIPGTFPGRLKLKAAEDALEEAVPEAQLEIVSEDKQFKYAVLVVLKEQANKALEALKPCGFFKLAFSGLKGTPKDCINLSKAELNSLGDRKIECFDKITAVAERRKELKLALDKLGAQMAMAGEEEKLLATDSTVSMTGWVPAEKEPELEKLLSDFVCAWSTEDPSEEEYPQVPVKLKNNLLTNGLNMVTNMYSLPQYGTVDPNPLMAPFFILFYGLMMADMGYGILMIIAAVIAMKKIKPRDNSLSFCQLLLWGGISTFAMGALTGSLFSDIPLQLYQIFNPAGTWKGIPALFSPVEDSEMVLYGSMILGALHLNAGMVVSFVQKVKAGNTADAIWEEGSLWVLLVGGILAVFKIGNVAGVPVVLVVALAMLLFGAGRHSKGFGKVTAAFGCIYNTATGWFGDVLSYSRIMALMLAGGVVGQVFNTVATMPMKNSGVTVFTFIAFVIIFLLGHAINFALNLLGCYVHDLRLQCLEFFGKFYVDGGKPFTPLKFGGKYVRAKDN